VDVRTIHVVVSIALAFLAGPLAAQEFSLGAGLTDMAGRIGSSRSDWGVTGRIGVLLGSGTFVRFGFEGAVERLNLHYQRSSSTCFLPGGGTGACTFELWERDTGWSLAGPGLDRSRPTQYSARGS
jgi:hypothetical protein